MRILSISNGLSTHTFIYFHEHFCYSQVCRIQSVGLEPALQQTMMLDNHEIDSEEIPSCLKVVVVATMPYL